MIRACSLADLPTVGAVCAVIDGHKVAVARDSSGRCTPSTTPAATRRYRCPKVTSRDRTIECWLHGSSFDLITGAPTSLPATIPIAVHDVEVDGRTSSSSSPNELLGRHPCQRTELNH